MPKRFDATTCEEGAARRALAPTLQIRPDFCPGLELLPLADEDGNLLLQRPLVRGRDADEFDLIPVALQHVLAIVEDDHAVSGIVVRSPEPIGAVAAHRAREALVPAKEVDRPGLPVILGEDAAICTFVRGDAVPR